MLGLNERVAGTVTLFGVDSNEFHDRARLGYVPQRHTLSASVRATAEEIVSTGRLSRIGWLGRLRATDRQIVARSLEVVGLADRAATEVSTLSGGQQRRVLIARALAGQPDVLIMDEPTAGVDAANQHVLADVLARLVERDVTMVIVTHELGALERLLTRIVVIDGGRIRFDGTPQEYAHARDRVHHDHDSHHHDLELDGHRPSLARAPSTSPTRTEADRDRPAHRRLHAAGPRSPHCSSAPSPRWSGSSSSSDGSPSSATGWGTSPWPVSPSASSPARRPVLTALVAAVVAAVVIELLRTRGRTNGDVALAVIFYGGIAGGVVIISKSPDGTPANLDEVPLRLHPHDAAQRPLRLRRARRARSP